LTLCCVALTAFFGLACALEDDGDFGVIPCLAEDASLSPDERSRALPGEDSRRLDGAPSGPRHRAPSLPAAVRGGFCLLI